MQKRTTEKTEKMKLFFEMIAFISHSLLLRVARASLIFCLTLVSYFQLCTTSVLSSDVPPQLSPPNPKIIGEKIYDVKVFDHTGREFRISELLGERPVVLSPIYTKCPMACSLITANVKEVVSKVGELGEKFYVISFSFDETDTEEDLLTFKKRWEIDGESWRIVSARRKQEIDKFLSSLDFKIWRDPKTGEIIHPNTVFFITPEGKISGFLNALRMSEKDFKIALEKSGKGKVFGLLSSIISNCYRYNPATGKYEIDMQIVAHILAGTSLFLGILIFIIAGKLKKRRNHRYDS